MENMSHFMEESHHVIMTHQRWLFRGGFGEVGNHSGEGVGAFAIWKVITGQEGPDCRVRVFGLCEMMRGAVDIHIETNLEGRGPSSNSQ